jgi:hypothetical protein
MGSSRTARKAPDLDEEAMEDASREWWKTDRLRYSWANENKSG